MCAAQLEWHRGAHLVFPFSLGLPHFRRFQCDIEGTRRVLPTNQVTPCRQHTAKVQCRGSVHQCFVLGLVAGRVGCYNHLMRFAAAGPRGNPNSRRCLPLPLRHPPSLTGVPPIIGSGRSTALELAAHGVALPVVLFPMIRKHPCGPPWYLPAIYFLRAVRSKVWGPSQLSKHGEQCWQQSETQSCTPWNTPS